MHPSQKSLGRSFEFASLAKDLGLTIRERRPATRLLRLKLGFQLMFRQVAQRFPGLFNSLGFYASESTLISEKFTGNLSRVRYLDGYFLNLPAMAEAEPSFLRFLGYLESELSRYLTVESIRDAEVSSLHLRLGDFKKDSPNFLPRISALQNVFDSDFEESKTNLFSDEPELAVTLLSALRNVQFNVISAQLGTKHTLGLMANSEKLICSNSTFSWWAASLVANKGGKVWWPDASLGRTNLKPADTWAQF